MAHQKTDRIVPGDTVVDAVITASRVLVAIAHDRQATSPAKPR